MSESMTSMEAVLNLVPDKRHKKEDNFEVFNQLYEVLRPQAEALVNQAAEIYKQATDSLMRLVPGDWDVDRFPEPATDPVPVSLVRLLDTHGNPAREMEMRIRGKDQIALAHSDEGVVQYEHLFQRINPKDLTPNQRLECAKEIQNAQAALLMENNIIYHDPDAHDKQLAVEIEAFEKGIDRDIWIPFDAKGVDVNGNEAVHLIKWGGRRPEEVAASYLADMADGSAYRDNPNNVANLVADHLKLHPIDKVFQANVPDGQLPTKNLAITNPKHETIIDPRDGNEVLLGKSMPVDNLIAARDPAKADVKDIEKAVKEGLLKK